MSQSIQPFAFKGMQVRALTDNYGNPWFVAKDVCDILGLNNVGMALSALDADEKSNISNTDVGGISTISGYGTSNGGRAPAIISEAGLYSLALRSRKPEAKEFKRWVTHEVLPSIRKHGGYLAGQGTMSPEEMVLASVNYLQSKISEQQRQLEEQAPKVLFADSVTASKSSILIGAFAKDLKQNGVDIGQNRMFQWLRDNGYLISRKGESWNQPTQRAMDMGLFEVKTNTSLNPDGSVRTTYTTMLTGKGRIYFTSKFLGKGNA